jgi:hypothetical protein
MGDGSGKNLAPGGPPIQSVFGTVRPSSRATTARRSLRGERRPLSSAVGIPQFYAVRDQPTSVRASHVCRALLTSLTGISEPDSVHLLEILRAVGTMPKWGEVEVRALLDAIREAEPTLQFDWDVCR